MTTAFNDFGATRAAVLLKFKLAGYAPTADEFGGDDAIDDAIADAVHAIVQAMPALVRDSLQLPTLLKIEARAASGQTSAFIRLVPLVEGKVHLWQGQPAMFTSQPVLQTNPWRENQTGWLGIGGVQAPSPTPPSALWENQEDTFSVDYETGEVTLVNPLNRNDQVYVSCEVAIDDPAYVLPSLADLVAAGAAANLGFKVYPQASSQWEYVTRLGAMFGDTVKALAAGEWVPTELRTLQWWKAPEPDTAEGRIGSVSKYRA